MNLLFINGNTAHTLLNICLDQCKCKFTNTALSAPDWY